jgi:hypothetical protein
VEQIQVYAGEIYGRIHGLNVAYIGSELEQARGF